MEESSNKWRNIILRQTVTSAYTNALSEEIAHPTVYHHLSQLSVDIHLSGLIKCRANPGVQCYVDL